MDSLDVEAVCRDCGGEIPPGTTRCAKYCLRCERFLPCSAPMQSEKDFLGTCTRCSFEIRHEEDKPPKLACGTCHEELQWSNLAPVSRLRDKDGFTYWCPNCGDEPILFPPWSKLERGFLTFRWSCWDGKIFDTESAAIEHSRAIEDTWHSSGALPPAIVCGTCPTILQIHNLIPIYPQPEGGVTYWCPNCEETELLRERLRELQEEEE